MVVPAPYVAVGISFVFLAIVYAIVTRTTFLHRLLVLILHRVLRQSSAQHTTKRIPNGRYSCFYINTDWGCVSE